MINLKETSSAGKSNTEELKEAHQKLKMKEQEVKLLKQATSDTIWMMV